jgi:DNA-binding winged helix-turn-helix (wHTH) protein/predicted ATPase
MVAETTTLGDPFRLDLANECVWRGQVSIKLTPKAFAVLRYLTEHPGRVITKAELLQAVWPGIVVSEWVLAANVHQIRQALADRARSPQFIETVHRRGYRFIAPLNSAPPVTSNQLSVVSEKQGRRVHSRLATGNWQLKTHLVGREAELAQLHNWLEKALRGERQIVFITGEPGIGKTTVVEAFLTRLAFGHEHEHEHELWLSRGQCIEHYGAAEAYLPVIEAMVRLCREPQADSLLKVLERHAPSWLLQMPSLLNVIDLEALQCRGAGATKDRMLREMAEAMEALSVEQPLVLVLEDLHWSDVSTLDLLSMVARRPEWARLLVIGTYRPVEVLGDEHPLRAIKQELQSHRYCEELRLGMLNEEHVAEYLAARCLSEVGAPGQWKNQAEAVPLQKLARTIHHRTEGNPLFMVSVVEELLARGRRAETDSPWEFTSTHAEAEIGVPETIQQMIEQQFVRLGAEEQQLLEVASVAGVEFSAAAVAAGIESTVATVEARCANLVQRGQFLRPSGVSEWPDGTIATRYGFLHALYQETVYQRVTAGRGVELHRRIGEREEAAYGTQVREIAAELAMHFERGRDYHRAVHYLVQAGQNALRRSAYQDAVSLLSKGRELLTLLPATPERTQHELTLLLALGSALQATQGYAAREAAPIYARAREICEHLGNTPQLFPALRGLRFFYSIRGEHRNARQLGKHLLRLTRSVREPALLLEAHAAVATPLFCLGEFSLARRHAEQGIALYEPHQHRSHTFLYGQDPGGLCLIYAALSLWQLGYPDQALRRIDEALTAAQELAHPFSLAFAIFGAALIHIHRREWQAAQERARSLLPLATEQGFLFLVAMGTFLQGRTLVEEGQAQGRLVQTQQGLTALRATGLGAFLPRLLAWLAEAHMALGQTEQGLAVLAEALEIVDKTGEREYEAEVYRLKGELLLQQFKVQGSKPVLSLVEGFQVENPQSAIRNPQSEAEEYFRKALAVARRQEAKSLELRAAMSLARLWQSQGKQAEAHNVLSEVYNWFTEGFETKDLQEAEALIEELSHRAIEPLRD